MAVRWTEKFAFGWCSNGGVNRLCLVMFLLPTSMLLLVTALEMERTKGGCLQVTLQAGEHIKANPRCIVSRGTGLAIRPPPTVAVDDAGLLGGLKRRIRKAAHCQHQHSQQREKLRGNPTPLQRLSNTMASNATECLLAPSFPGDIALVSVSSGGRRSGSEESGGEGLSTTSRSRSRSRSSSGQRSGRSNIGVDTDVDEPRSRRSSVSARTRGYNAEKPKLRKLVVLTQALVAVGPEVTVKAMASEDQRRGGGGGAASSSPRLPQHRQRGALSVCEGQGTVAAAGYGKLQALRLRPGQKRVVDSSRAVGWTSGVMCLAGAGGGTPRGKSTTNDNNKSNEAASPSAVATFVGPGTVYVQTHSLSGLRRLLLPKPGVGGSHHVYGDARRTSDLLGVGSRGRAVSHTPRRGAVVGLSLKRGLAKSTKAGAKRALLGLAFLAVYAVVTALLLEGRAGLVNAPRHAVQVARSLMAVARRVTVLLIRLAREELWRNGEGEGQGEAGYGSGGGAALPDGKPMER